MSIARITRFRRPGDSQAFNITPIIDIVFLLIIFFLVVCQFVEAENFPVTVPDQCDAAGASVEPGRQPITVTVMKNSAGRISYAVGPDVLSPPADRSAARLTDALKDMIDRSLSNRPQDRRIVTLRVDKDIAYGRAQHALAAIANSTATDVQLAVVRGELQAPESPNNP